jgi:hypothetical protein
MRVEGGDFTGRFTSAALTGNPLLSFFAGDFFFWFIFLTAITLKGARISI